jgi:hypothetical protein
MVEKAAAELDCLDASPRKQMRVEEPQEDHSEVVTSTHRDEMVAALVTVSSALGLASETLHICVDLLDRYLRVDKLEASRLEVLCIA